MYEMNPHLGTDAGAVKLDTLTELKDLIDNPQFKEQKKKALFELSRVKIDTPIVDLIKRLNNLPYCFTLQSCYGHFVYEGQTNPNNLEPLIKLDTNEKVKYRISYIAFCIENTPSGRDLLEALKEIAAIDPDYIQFFCAQWFWNRQVNSYVLQVEPDRFKDNDMAIVDYKEALFIEEIRNKVFSRVNELQVQLNNKEVDQ
jgi:hypothetical protein